VLIGVVAVKDPIVAILSSAMYSKIRTSAYTAAAENVTVTVLLLDEAIFDA
jgi:hypothetical protein